MYCVVNLIDYNWYVCIRNAWIRSANTKKIRYRLSTDKVYDVFYSPNEYDDGGDAEWQPPVPGGFSYRRGLYRARIYFFAGKQTVLRYYCGVRR